MHGLFGIVTYKTLSEATPCLCLSLPEMVLSDESKSLIGSTSAHDETQLQVNSNVSTVHESQSDWWGSATLTATMTAIQ